MTSQEIYTQETAAKLARLGDDPEFEDIYDALSSPPSGMITTRRRFLTGAGAASAALVMAACRPVDPFSLLSGGSGTRDDDPILVVIMLGGGNDGLNMIGPYNDPLYKKLRPSVNVANGSIPAANGLRFHPALKKLAARYASGKVAVVNGVGNPVVDTSHFSSMAAWMAGTAGSDRRTGWLGRYLDSVDHGAEGLAGIAVDGAVPLHIVGDKGHFGAVGITEPWGLSKHSGQEVALNEALRHYGDEPTGRGPASDMLAALTRQTLDQAEEISAAYTKELTGRSFVKRMELAARLINLGLGTRVLTVALGSFDTHSAQLGTHTAHFEDLDAAIEKFYATLTPWRAGQVTLMTFSEFGRRAAENGSGTDHGSSAPLLVIGDRVRGGMYGRYPSLGDLDRGQLEVTTDFRSVYGSVLEGWMGADSKPILGGTYPTLDLFKSKPKSTKPSPPAGARMERLLPFVSAEAFLYQMYADFHGSMPTSEYGIWLARLKIAHTPAWQVMDGIWRESAYYKFGLDIARMHGLGLGTELDFEDYLRWIDMRINGDDLSVIAREITATERWRDKYGRMWTNTLVNKLFADFCGRVPTATELVKWKNEVSGVGAQDGLARLVALLSASGTATNRYNRKDQVVAALSPLLRTVDHGPLTDQLVGMLRSGKSTADMFKVVFGHNLYLNRFK